MRVRGTDRGHRPSLRTKRLPEEGTAELVNSSGADWTPTENAPLPVMMYLCDYSLSRPP